MQTLMDRAATAPLDRVALVMAPAKPWVRPDATAREAAAMLSYYGATSLPVADRAGRLAGVISAADVLHLQDRLPGRDDPECRAPAMDVLDRHHAREIMMPALFTVGPEATLCELADLLRESGAERVLVVEDGILRGIITTTDLLRALTS
jgi:CBS domain-containing protein